MSTAKLTLYSMYKYKLDNGGNLFSNLSVPSSVDSNTLINNILLRGGEFETFIPVPDLLESAIGLWSTKWSRTFTKWADALSLTYNPIHNYDRTEEWTEDEETENDGTISGTSAGSSTIRFA